METTVILSPQDVELFKQFQQHYELFKAFEEKGVFTVGFGKVILNIAFGKVQNVVREEVVWKR